MESDPTALRDALFALVSQADAPSQALLTLLGLLAVILMISQVLGGPRRAIGTVDRPDAISLYGAGSFLVGDLWHLLAHSDQLLDDVLEHVRKVGAGVSTVTVPFCRFVLLTEPDAIEHILKTKAAQYDKPWAMRAVLAPVLGSSIVTLNGHAWAEQRRIVMRIFKSPSLKRTMSDSVAEHLQLLTQSLSHAGRNGQEVDLSSFLDRFIQDTVVRIALGRELGGIASEAPGKEAAAFEYLVKRMTDCTSTPGLPIAHSWTRAGRATKKALTTIDALIDSVIDEADEQNDSWLRTLCEMETANDGDLDRKQLRDTIVSLILAGRDTSSQTIAWSLWHILTDDKLLAAVREEVDRQLADEELVEHVHLPPALTFFLNAHSFENMSSLPYTKAVFYEAARLYPGIPKNARVARQDDVLPGGELIRKGDILVWMPWVSARLESVWGPGACEFKPSRWLSDSGNFQQRPRKQFQAFHLGPRSCPGTSLSTLEAVATIAELVRQFDMRLTPSFVNAASMLESQPGRPSSRAPKYAMSLSLPMATPLQVTLRPRNADPLA